MVGRFRIVLSCALVLAGAAGLLGSLVASAAQDSAPSVVVVPITGTVDDGMAHLVARGVDQANETHAAALVLDVNTPGGLVSSAFEIRDAMFRAKVPTIAFISQRAYSAGALISLSARRIEMAPGSSIGAAEPIPKTVKFVSALSSEFASTAARNHRDPQIARAMVDANVDAPAFKRSGAILTLTNDDAKRAGFSDGTVTSLDAALAAAGIHGATIAHVDYTWGENLARFATSPEISGFLLTLGFLGLLIEMQTLHGIAGTIGVASLALFFGTHVYSGFSNGLVIALALFGVLGILFELHVVPGHGLAGSLGAIALVAAVILAFGLSFVFVAIQTLAIAIVACVVLFFLATLVFRENRFASRLAFRSEQGPDYVASSDFKMLLGHTGVASSFLRPAGVATIDGKRIDVLTAGEFLPAGSAVRVSRVEGARIFVDPIS
jgi:membrane-bound serine protease (ClpP class)